MTAIYTSWLAPPLNVVVLFFVLQVYVNSLVQQPRQLWRDRAFYPVGLEVDYSCWLRHGHQHWLPQPPVLLRVPLCAARKHGQ